jgi:serine/threonine-protein kinase
MSFFEELKKRHVFKVGAAYAIVAWLLVQAADVFVPALHLPDWVITLVAGLVLAGFPIALLLAWAYEITPGGVVPNRDAPASTAPTGQRFNAMLLGLVVLAVAFLMVDRFVLTPGVNPVAAVSTGKVESRPLLAATVPLTRDAPLGVGTANIGFDSPSIALSPDSRWLVYVSSLEGQSRLVRHRLDDFGAPEAIAGTEGAIFAFFSPDGRYIGFLTNERIKRVPVTGDDVKTIASSRSPVRAQWLTPEAIHFIDDQGASLRSVDVASGEVKDLLLNQPLLFSGVLPGGAWALASQRHQSISGDYAKIMRVDLATGAFEPLGVTGFDARLASGGHLLFGRNGNIYAAPFDAAKMSLTGEPLVILRDVAMDSTFSQVHMALSSAGTLAFVPGTDRAVGQILAVDANGTEKRLPPAPQRYGVMDLDHDDRQLAVQVGDVKDYVWVYDLEQDRGRKLAGSTGYGWPKFSRDGAIAMAENSAATIDTRIRVVPAHGAEPRLVFESGEYEAVVSDWSPDGRQLVLSEWVETKIGLLPLAGDEQLEFFDSPVLEWGGVFSPDGQWLAFSSDESGRFEIWVRSVHGEGGPRTQVSVNGGIEGVWCPCGRIFFRRGDEFLSVAVETEPELRFGPEELAFVVPDFLDTPGRSFDVSSDGRTLYTLKRAKPAIVDRVHLLSEWRQRLSPNE